MTEQESPAVESRDRIARAVRETVSALARGDVSSAQSAFCLIHDYYYWRINRFVRANLRASQDPEWETDDLTAETFLQLWMGIGNIDADRAPISGLLYTIARRLVNHRSKRNFRDRGREALPSGDEGIEGLLDTAAARTGPAPDALAGDADAPWREENRSRLLQLLELEAPEAHRFLVLRYHQQLPFRAVAQHLAISPDSARQRDMTVRLTVFKFGWRIIREEEQIVGNSLRWHRPLSVGQLAEAVEGDPQVAQLFSDYFGAASWRLVMPRRDPDAKR